MGIFGTPEYVPNAKEKWQQRQRDAADERRRWEREQAAAKKLRDEQQREVEKEAERAQKESEALYKEQLREMRAAEKEMLTKPHHRVEGGSKALGDTPVILWHWQVPLPPEHNTAVNGQKRSDAGPLLALWDGGGIAEDDVIPLQLVASVGETPALKEWAKRAGDALEEVEKRYPIVADLRDDAALERLLRPVGVLRKFDETLPERGVVPAEDGSPIMYQRPVTVTELPTVSAVEVVPDGLRITFAYRAGETAKRWTSHLDALRVAFNANGVHNASNLRVKDGVNGELILDFDDAPASFPLAVSPTAPHTTPSTVAEAIERYDRTRWMLGVDARGAVVSYPIAAQPHVLVTGGTGGGKSVWARSVIEMLRTGYRDTEANNGKGLDCGGGWLAFISDGKGSDFSALADQPGIAMVVPGTDPAQVMAMVRRVRQEVERRFEQAGERKRQGHPNPFAGMQPWLMLLDEWGTTSIAIKRDFGKTSEQFLTDIDTILRLGRECRVHCVLASQTIRKTGDGMVPGSWQENLGLTVSLGAPSDITLQSDAFTPGTRDRAAFIGSRLKGKRGRGLTVDRENDTVVEFQSYYVWSRGTTSLSPDAPGNVRAPNADVRRSWEQWEPICESLPWLAPRVGIQVEDGTWREDAEDVYSSRLVPLTDRHGNPRPGAELSDPTSPKWLGKKGNGTVSGAAPVDDFAFTDEDGDGVDDHAQPTSDTRPTVKAERAAESVPTEPEPVEASSDTAALMKALQGLTPDRLAEMTRLLSGDVDASAPATVAETPETAAPEGWD